MRSYVNLHKIQRFIWFVVLFGFGFGFFVWFCWFIFFFFKFFFWSAFLFVVLSVFSTGFNRDLAVNFCGQWQTLIYTNDPVGSLRLSICQPGFTLIFQESSKWVSDVILGPVWCCVLVVLWLLLFHGVESRNKVNIRNRKVIRTYTWKWHRNLSDWWKRGEIRWIICHFYVLILFFTSAPFPSPASSLLSPNAFHFCSLFLCNV